MCFVEQKHVIQSSNDERMWITIGVLKWNGLSISFQKNNKIENMKWFCKHRFVCHGTKNRLERDESVGTAAQGLTVFNTTNNQLFLIINSSLCIKVLCKTYNYIACAFGFYWPLSTVVNKYGDCTVMDWPPHSETASLVANEMLGLTVTFHNIHHWIQVVIFF